MGENEGGEAMNPIQMHDLWVVSETVKGKWKVVEEVVKGSMGERCILQD